VCRLVAYAGPPLPLESLVFHGEHSLFRQSWAPRELLSGSVNVDGYGVAWSDGSGEVRRLARAEPIWYDDDLRDVLGAVAAPVAQAALRNATPGLPVDRSALLPLVREGWAFTLNGAVPDFRAGHMRALRSGLSDARYASLTGVSDAETLFLHALEAMAAGASPVEALARTVEAVAARLGAGERAALTMVMSSHEGVFVAHRSVGGGPCNSLYLSESPGWAPGGLVLASEALDGVGPWRALPPQSDWVLRPDGGVTQLA
jgi:glutamine amidotransferase